MIQRSHPAVPGALPAMEGQLAFYGIDDPQWLPTLLKHLALGGCIVVERSGDLLIMPAP